MVAWAKESEEESEDYVDPVQSVIYHGFELGYIISEAAVLYVMNHHMNTLSTEEKLAHDIIYCVAVMPPFVTLSDVWNSYPFETRDDEDYGMPVGKLWVEWVV